MSSNQPDTEPSESDLAESDLAESDLAESDLAESDLAESDLAESDLAESDLAESDAGEPGLTDEDVEYAQKRFAPPEGSTQLLLVRHGASQASRPGELFPLLDGQGDPPLAPEGREQAELVGARLASETIDALYVTTLQRTHQTAAPLISRTGLEPVVEPDLREVFLGEWEGGAFREHVANEHPLVREMGEKQRWDVIPGAERDEEFRERVVGAITRIRQNHQGQRVVAVVHGGVIAAAISHTVGVSGWTFGGAENCSIHHMVLLDDTWILRSFNDIAHLGPILHP